MNNSILPDALADKLAGLYAEQFSGKTSGRYRVALKAIRDTARHRRLYEDDVRDQTRAMYERGYALIDMDSFFSS